MSWVHRGLTFSNSPPSVSLSISCSKLVTFWLIWDEKNKRDAMKREHSVIICNHSDWVLVKGVVTCQTWILTSRSSTCDKSSFTFQRDSSCSTLFWRRCKIPSCGCSIIDSSVCARDYNAAMNAIKKKKKNSLTVSTKTFLYVSQSFCRIFWFSSASFSFSASPYKKDHLYLYRKYKRNNVRLHISTLCLPPSPLMVGCLVLMSFQQLPSQIFVATPDGSNGQLFWKVKSENNRKITEQGSGCFQGRPKSNSQAQLARHY